MGAPPLFNRPQKKETTIAKSRRHLPPITAWQGWYHCTVSTYGTWLPGDPRGWRERNHHEHVEGDYKNPPKPTKFARGRLQHSKRIMRGEPYHFQPQHREHVGKLLLENFARQKVSVAALAVCKSNVHILLRKPDGLVKKSLGMAKRHVTFEFSPPVNDQTRERQRIWEGEGGAKPIHDLQHGKVAVQYILDHIAEGAWVWSFRDSL